MTRPLFVPDHPRASYNVSGGSLTLTAQDLSAPYGPPAYQTCYEDDNVSFVRLRTQQASDPRPSKDALEITLSADQVNLWLTVTGDQLALYLDQDLYQITPSSPAQEIVLLSKHGADTICIDDTVRNPVTLYSGAGDDYLAVGGNHSKIMSGPGNDTIKITSSACYIEAGSGDDTVRINSAEAATVYTGDGDDIVRAGAGLSFIDAGTGADIIIGGAGHAILSGGSGQDSLRAGDGTSVIYTGSHPGGVTHLKPTDKVFANDSSTLVALDEPQRREWIIDKLTTPSLPGAQELLETLTLNPTRPFQEARIYDSEAGKLGVSIEGHAEFKARTESDLELLRSSAIGQKLLQALDLIVAQGGRAVKVQYTDRSNAVFEPSVPVEPSLLRLPGDPPDPVPPYIKDGLPGPAAPGGTIYYNPQFSRPGLIPLVGLYHELCHAYNAMTGTVVPGRTEETVGGKTAQIDNVELQAVGLPIPGMTPFDFDLDPLTPPTLTNPEAYTENGLRKELGLPLRRSYLQGDGEG